MGELASGRQQIDDRWALYIKLSSMEAPPNSVAPQVSPILFEPRITEAFDDQIRVSGLERTEDRAWCLQEWDCFVLPTLRRT